VIFGRNVRFTKRNHQAENVGFMEAVQILAGEAGMPVPQSDPRAQEKADERTVLADVMEQAVQHFRLNLQTAAAGAARDYLVGRGLDAEAQARWDIGFAPEGGGVLGHLTGKGIAQKLVLDAGLAAESDRGGSPYDRFRGRIIFPTLLKHCCSINRARFTTTDRPARRQARGLR